MKGWMKFVVGIILVAAFAALGFFAIDRFSPTDPAPPPPPASSEPGNNSAVIDAAQQAADAAKAAAEAAQNAANAVNAAASASQSPPSAPSEPVGTVVGPDGQSISGFTAEGTRLILDSPKVFTRDCEVCNTPPPPAEPPTPRKRPVYVPPPVSSGCDDACQEFKRLKGASSPAGGATPGCVWVLQDRPGPLVLRKGLTNTGPVAESYPTGTWKRWSRDKSLYVKQICPNTSVADRTLCGEDGHSSWSASQVRVVLIRGVPESDPACLLGKGRCSRYGL